ncbi:Eukaryotic translation initiation factor 4 gamma 3 [Nymphon striatum]|nr:Eukaryotic translation initiation factor 4 gamma 3 [Nymphon striatum]
MAKTSFWKCKEFLRRDLALTLKKRLLDCYVKSVAAYGCEAWTFSKDIIAQINALQLWCYRRMLKVKYTDHVTNKKVKELIGAENIQWADDVARRKLKFAGHVMRGCCDTLTQLVLEGLVEGKRDRGRQRKVWGDDLKEWTKSKNLGEVKRKAENKVVWRIMVHDLRFKDALVENVTEILNKLTPSNFQSVSNEFTKLKINSQEKIEIIIDILFQKTLEEPKFVKEYSDLCKNLIQLRMSVISSENVPLLALNKVKEIEQDKNNNQYNTLESNDGIQTVEDNVSYDQINGSSSETEPDSTELVNGQPAYRLKYVYKPDQWSPLNTEGKKQYDLNFLKQLQYDELSQVKPQGLHKRCMFRKKAVDETKSSQKGQSSSMERLNIDVDVKLQQTDNAEKPSVLRETEGHVIENETMDFVCKVTEILNKINPTNVKTVYQEFTKLKINSQEKMDKVIDLLFRKVLEEPKCVKEFADLCKTLIKLRLKVTSSEEQDLNDQKK